MAVQGIGGGASPAMSFNQINVKVSRDGNEATAEKMYESLPHVSNAGTETRAGTSEFSRTNDEIVRESVEKMAEIMEKDNDVMNVSNTGSETNISPSGFHELNNTSLAAQNSTAANAAQAYKYFND